MSPEHRKLELCQAEGAQLVSQVRLVRGEVVGTTPACDPPSPPSARSQGAALCPTHVGLSSP